MLLQCNYFYKCSKLFEMVGGNFTWIDLFGMVASQHPLRIGLTQSGLLPLVASSSQLSYSKPFKNISCADVFAFSCSSMPKSTRFARLFIQLICILKQASNPASSHKLLLRRALSTAPRNKKARTVRAGFVTPSGFKPETF